MKKPNVLKKGSVVRIISTARKITPSEVAPSIKMLTSWGLKVELGRNLYSTHNQFAGTTSQRLQDLQSALDDDRVELVWCSRGGYGTTMLLDDIDFDGFVKHPKWVVGYSDVTSLLCHITENLKITTVHATMPINVNEGLNEASIRSVGSLKDWLFGRSLNYSLKPHKLSKTGDANGQIIGGNLSILYSLLGSNSSPNTDGRILFIEDLDEYLYHMDRMMVNMKRNGLLSGLSALLVGGMTDMNDNAVPYGKTAEEIVLDHVKDFNYPVYFGVEAGHMSPNLALPFGVHAEIKDNQISINQ